MSASAAQLNGSGRTASYVSATQLKVMLTAADLSGGQCGHHSGKSSAGRRLLCGGDAYDNSASRSERSRAGVDVYCPCRRADWNFNADYFDRLGIYCGLCCAVERHSLAHYLHQRYGCHRPSPGVAVEFAWKLPGDRYQSGAGRRHQPGIAVHRFCWLAH